MPQRKDCFQPQKLEFSAHILQGMKPKCFSFCVFSTLSFLLLNKFAIWRTSNNADCFIFFVTALCTWLSYIIFSDAICQWWSCSFMPQNVLSRQKMKWDSLCWGREHSGKMYCSRWATGSFFHVGKIDDNTFYSRVCILQFSNCLLSWLKIH